MKLAGIIAEYDPFHNGHAWQLAQAKAMGAESVAVAMSCGLTQRGAVPLLPEEIRVRAALTCGADLVFALPAPSACSGAEAFARAGVRILSAAGCDALLFGAETPDVSLLMKAARLLLSDTYRDALKAQLAGGARSFAAARQTAVESLCPASGIAGLLDKPNNNLAIEYCKAILEQNTAMTPIPLPRQGANHGESLAQSSTGQFASASALRKLWVEQGVDAVRSYVPASVFPLYKEAFLVGRHTNFSAAGRCELALLRAACRVDSPFSQIRGISEGLEHRLENAVHTCATPEELLDAMTTVRYPRARMRRLAIDAALGYTPELNILPPYLHLLGGRRELFPLLKKAQLPVSHSLSRLREESTSCAAFVQAQLTASDFVSLCRQKPEPMGGLLRQKIIFLT